MNTFCKNIQLLFEESAESLGFLETGVFFCVSQCNAPFIKFEIGTEKGLEICKEHILKGE